MTPALLRLLDARQQPQLLFFTRVMKTGSTTFLDVLSHSATNTTVISWEGFSRRYSRWRAELGGAPTAPGGVQWLLTSTSKHVWLQAHLLSFEYCQGILSQMAPPPTRPVTLVTIFRKPLPWLRSFHGHFETEQHDKARRGKESVSFAAWSQSHKAKSAMIHFMLALPSGLTAPFERWLDATKGLTSTTAGSGASSSPSSSSLSSASASAAAAAAAAAAASVPGLDVDGARDHLRAHYVCLLTEQLAVGVAMLSFAWLGDERTLLLQADGHEKNTREKRSSHTSNATQSALAADLEAAVPDELTRRLQPLEALYEQATRLFAEELAVAARAGCASCAVPPQDAL